MTLFWPLFLIALPIFIVLDILWLGFVAKDLYQKQIGFMLKEKVFWPAAIVFYLIFVGALVLLTTTPAVRAESWLVALSLGALFGLAAYSAYDLTNLATTKNWPLKITIIDMLWGTWLGATVSVLTYLIFTVIIG